MTLKDLEKVLYFENYIVVEPGLTPLKKGQLLTETEFLDAEDEYGEENFSAGIGAEVLKLSLKILISRNSKQNFAQSLRAQHLSFAGKKL